MGIQQLAKTILLNHVATFQESKRVMPWGRYRKHSYDYVLDRIITDCQWSRLEVENGVLFFEKKNAKKYTFREPFVQKVRFFLKNAQHISVAPFHDQTFQIRFWGTESPYRRYPASHITPTQVLLDLEQMWRVF